VSSAKISVLHPLVHTNTSDLSRQSYGSTFTGEEFFTKGYQYQGKKILPAATYFEMARVAVDRATPVLQKTNILELRNIVCENPIMINQNKEVIIALLADDRGQIEFEIFYGDKDKEVVYCVGQAQFVNGAKSESLPIKKLQEQMQQRNISMADVYAEFAKMGLNYGASFKGITAIYHAHQQILVQLHTLEVVAESQDDYVLHPCLMDSVVQSSVCLLTDFNVSRLTSPPSFALDLLSIASACTKDMYAWIRFAQHSGNTNALDIDLCDERGNVCVQMKGLSIPQLTVSVDHQAQQMLSMMEDAFTSFASSKPKQIKLTGLQDASDPVTDGYQVTPVKISQRSLEPTAKPFEMVQSSFEQEMIYFQTQSHKIPAAEVYDYLDTMKSSQSSGDTNEMIYQDQLQRQLTMSLAEALYLNASDIDVDKSFIDLGLDSIVGVEWLSTINKRYKIAIPASVVYDYPTIRTLASFLHQEVNNKGNIVQDIAASETSLTSY
jgi:acyl carrier protein